MSHTDLVAAELPYLRRYARAITGNQADGDAFVRSTLEAYLETPSVFDEGQPIRPQLYRLFHTGWNSTVSPDRESANPLAQLGARARHALMLWSVEGFGLDDIAVILGCEAEQVRAEMEAAKAVIADNLRSNVMIIEDEPVIALHIQQICAYACRGRRPGPLVFARTRAGRYQSGRWLQRR
jgi:DNA-directed RNA polymerase specialized sigma24 family protein